MLPELVRFAGALRDAGIPVSTSETIDAAAALGFETVARREGMRVALAATLVKSQAHRHAFDTLFDLYFLDGKPDDAVPPPEGTDTFNQRVVEALASGDGASAGALAREAVARFGRVEDSPTGTRYYAYPVFRVLDMRRLLGRAQREIEAEGGSATETRLRRSEAARTAASFEEAVRADVAARVAAQRGPEAVASYSVRPLPEDVDLLSATSEQLAELRRAIRPLARKLAARVAMKRRRAHRGTLDIRHTLRRSMSSGGVPFEPRFRHRPPHRPVLFVLCDLSDSVGRFARFSLMFVHALSSEFTKVRSFAFVDTLDEVTRLFEGHDLADAADRLGREARVVAFDSHSDYGTALERFWENYGKDVDGRASVLILGDARNNFRSTGTWVLDRLSKTARHVYWLNPEPEGFWDTGDSEASTYAAHVDAMVEVRNVRQLENFIERLD